MSKPDTSKKDRIKGILMSIHQIGADFMHGKIADYILVAMLKSEVNALDAEVRK